MPTDDLEAAWADIHDATPPGWLWATLANATAAGGSSAPSIGPKKRTLAALSGVDGDKAPTESGLARTEDDKRATLAGA